VKQRICQSYETTHKAHVILGDSLASPKCRYHNTIGIREMYVFSKMEILYGRYIDIRSSSKSLDVGDSRLVKNIISMDLKNCKQIGQSRERLFSYVNIKTRARPRKMRTGNIRNYYIVEML
jgi:hypothetical protein